MNYDEILVGSVALILSIAALSFAFGPWTKPYELKTIAAVADRFGKPAARGLWIVIAIAAFAAGTAILAGLRPGYADPTGSTGPAEGYTGSNIDMLV